MKQEQNGIQVCGYRPGGGACVEGGSACPARSLADVVCAEGGEVLTRRTVTGILLDDRGRAAGVAHTGPDDADRRVDRATVLFGNTAPSVLAGGATLSGMLAARAGLESQAHFHAAQ